MKNLWIVLAGACGLLVLAGVGKHFYSASSDSPEARSQARSHAIAAATAGAAGRGDRGGWIARPGGSAGDTAGSGSGSRETSLGSDQGGDRGGGASTVIGGGNRLGGGSGAGAASGSGRSGSDSIQAQGNVPVAAGPFAGGGLAARDARGQAGGSDSQQLVRKDDKSTHSEPEDPNAPVLSVPFDKTTDPEKGADQPAVDQEVQCGGGGEGCVFDTNSRYAIPDAGNLSGEAGSISFCLQPQWGGTDASNAGIVDLQTPNVWENRLKIFKNNEFFRFSIWPNNGTESGVSAKINSWQPGQWHPVTVTFGPDPSSGQNIASMYVDGNLVGQQPYDGQLQVPQQPLYIGSGIPGGEPTAGGALRNFQAYNRVLPPNEAASFASGCPQ